MNKTFHIVTFGCQMNKLDSEMLQAALQNCGMRDVDEPSEAQVLIYNTCSVRQHAEDKVMSNVGRWRKKAEADPDFIVGVVGCMAQRIGESILQKFPFVRFVCGTRSFLKVPEYINKTIETGRQVAALGDEPLEFERTSSLRSEPHHAYLSIMRGCTNFCTYCIVPYVRGPEVSRPINTIVEEALRLADDGVVEITLLGQNVNAYGRHKGRGEGARDGLPGLLDRMNGIQGLRRIRFVTSHPKDMTEDILKAVADNKKVCEHLHMPLQSGSDRVLGAMNRKYTRQQYLHVVDTAKKLIPGVEFSSDFIVGFPGETEEDFEQTLSFLRRLEFQQSYIFRYSLRPGTNAENLPDNVPDEVKRDRQQQLLTAQQKVDIDRRSSLIGKNLQVMCTGRNTSHTQEGHFIGRSRHNDIVVFDKNNSHSNLQPGDICDVRIKKASGLTLFGEKEFGC